LIFGGKDEYTLDYKDALEAYMKATNTHDFSHVEKLLDRDVIYWFSDQTCASHEEIRHYFEKAWTVIKEEVYTAADVKWIAVDQRMATCIYTYQWEGYHQGKFVSGSGRATNVFVRNDQEEWKLIHEHLSNL
jgi:ketosteroid isomerase-like protein